MTEEQRQERLKTLLPVNASQLEVDLLATFIKTLDTHIIQKFGDNDKPDIPIRHLYNPELCPPQALPHLATILSVDVDISVFSTTQQRALIRDSFTIHRQKGTVGSIYTAIESLGWEITEIVEGRRDPNDQAIIIRENGGWAQFTLKIKNVIPITQARAAAQLVQSTAPLSRKLIRFDFSSVANFYDGNPNDEGEYQFLYDGTFTYGAIATDESIG